MRWRITIALLLGLPCCATDNPLSPAAAAALQKATTGSNTGGTTAGATGNGNTIATAGPADTSTTLNYFQGMATGSAQFQALCARNNSDRFSKAYCANATPPSITSLADLFNLVGIAGKFGGNGTINFAINSQNASLVSRSTSVLNPRAILYDSATPFVAFGFARGDDVVEVAAQDPNTNDINFFLVHYQHSCNAAGTCTTGDAFTSQNENSWTSVDVYSGHEDLKNTVRQCDTCHRPQGFDYTTDSGSKAILRMQELVNPWTHWFRSNRGSAGLLATFCNAHSEPYATIPNNDICGNGAPQGNGGDPQTMEKTLIQAHNFDKNPAVITYQGNQINNDSNNFVGPPNNTWLGFYDQVLAAKLIHVPHYEINVFDDTQVNAAATTYKAVQGGQMPMSAMPDITADALTRPDALPILGHQALVTDPRGNTPATATQIVNQMCSTCHQGVFPGAGNRENFKVSDFPATLTADEKLKVANRICRPATSIYLMPPAMFGDMDDTARGLILTALGFPAQCPTVP